MPAQIRPTRLDVTDRFPMVGFRIRADGGPSQAEVAIAVDPTLFTPDRKKDRTAANFYSTRGNGDVRFQGSEAGYTVPPEILARFIGSEKLYFGLATAGDGGPMKVAVMPNETSPYISIRGLSGRSMSRIRVLPNRQQRAAGYKRTSQEQLEWAGDVSTPGMAPITNGAAPADAGPNATAGPAQYDDGFGPMPDTSAPPATTPPATAAQGLAARGVGYPPVHALSEEPVSLTPPEISTLGWVARQAAEVAIGMAPGGVGMLLNAVIALANSHGCSVGVGPQIGGGLGAGGALGYGVIFGKDGDLGVYGSAEIDIGFITSISATACVTIVQGGIDAFNGWNYGFAISGGEGIVGGAMILLNDKSEFVGASANVGIGAGFSPIDFYVAAQRGWSTRVQALALAHAHGLAAPMQARAYANGSGRGGARTTGAKAQALSTDVTTLDVRYRCFIPSPLIDSPFTVYGGDGRSFSENGGTSRGDLHARVTLAQSAAIENISIIDRHWGESTEYRTEDSYHVEGKPDWWLGKVEGAQPTKWDTLQATDDNLNITAGSTGSARNVQAAMENASIFSITAVGSLPLSMVAPAIDADIAILVRRSANGGIECKVVGEHDGFPCHELYVNGVQVYTYDPVAAGEGPTALKPTMDITASTDWIDCTGGAAVAQSLGSASWTVNWDDVELIPQPSDFSCWAAAGAMLVGWRDRVSLTPETIGEICSRSTGAGLDPGDVSAFGTEMGLVAEPPVSYSVDGFRSLLESRGPLWVAEALPGSLHAIIVTGLYSDGADTFVRIADPWDRVVGTPGAPGAYAASHSTGSRYIMRYEDFHAQYESAINGDPPNRQILHSGNPNALAPNTGQTAPPPGYAQGLGASRARAGALGTVVPSYSASDPRSILTQILDFFRRFGDWSTGVDVTRSMPHSAICQLQITQPDGSLAGGTGFFAGPGLIVTCAHALANAQSVRVYAGRTDDDFLTMFDVAPADWSSHPHFAATDDPYDIAVIRVQWAGGTAPNDNYFQMQDLQGSVGTKIVVSGYAGGDVNINRQHMDGSTIHELSPDGHHIFYNLQTAAGESGAPVLALMTDSGQDGWADAVRVVGIHVDSHSLTRNVGVRLTAEKISWILNRGMVAPAAYGLDATGGSMDTAPTDAELIFAPPPEPRARALDVLGAASTIGGLIPQVFSDGSGDVSWDLDQLKGLKHPNDKAPASPAPFTDAATIRLDDWPKLTGWGIDDIYAWFTVDWQHNGTSLGNIRIGNIGTNDAKLMKLKVRAQIMDDNILYEPGGIAALRIRFHYRFSRTPGDDIIAVTELQLFADGTYLRQSNWLQKSTI